MAQLKAIRNPVSFTRQVDSDTAEITFSISPATQFTIEVSPAVKIPVAVDSRISWKDLSDSERAEVAKVMAMVEAKAFAAGKAKAEAMCKDMGITLG